MGWTSLFVSLWFIFGVLLSFLGLIGIYIGKIFDETKNRPQYVIMNSTDNIKKQDINTFIDGAFYHFYGL